MTPELLPVNQHRMATELRRAGVLLTACVLLASACGQPGGRKNAEPESIPLEQRDLTRRYKGSGKVVPARSTDVKAEINGRVETVSVSLGEQVKEGQLLLELNRDEVENQQDEVKRSIESARLRAERAALDFRRKSELFERNLLPEQEFEQSRIDSELAANEWELEKARLETLLRRLEKAIIYAPHDGVILRLDARPGMVIVGASSISEGTKLMELGDLSALQVELQVSEVDVAGMRRDLPAKISFDALLDRRADGRVASIAPAATTDAKDPNLRYFPVIVAFQTDSADVRPGMSATVTIVLEEIKGAPALPVSAVFVDKLQSYVWVQEGEAWKRKDVTTGISDGAFVQIKSGLDAAAKVAATRPPGQSSPKSSPTTEGPDE